MPRKTTKRNEVAQDAAEDADMSDAPPPAQAAVENGPLESVEVEEQTAVVVDDDDDAQRVRLVSLPLLPPDILRQLNRDSCRGQRRQPPPLSFSKKATHLGTP